MLEKCRRSFYCWAVCSQRVTASHASGNKFSCQMQQGSVAAVWRQDQAAAALENYCSMTYSPRLLRAAPLLRMRETSLATDGFSATFRTLTGMALGRGSRRQLAS